MVATEVTEPREGNAKEASKRGRMSRARMASTMPVDAPIYPEPPYYYRNVERLTFTYETDEEAALNVLPDFLDLSLPATASVTFLNVPVCTLGRYQEAYQSLMAYLDEEPVEYQVYCMLTSDAAVAVGREIWGCPKKQAYISVERLDEFTVGILERPRGTRLCSARIRPERLIPRDHAHPTTRPLLSLRIIPDPEGKKESLIELIDHFNPKTNNFKASEEWWDHQFWGTGSVTFDAQTEIDPWHRLKVIRMLQARYSGGPSSFELPYGKILKTY